MVKKPAYTPRQYGGTTYTEMSGKRVKPIPGQVESLSAVKCTQCGTMKKRPKSSPTTWKCNNCGSKKIAVGYRMDPKTKKEVDR